MSSKDADVVIKILLTTFSERGGNVNFLFVWFSAD